MTSNCPNVGSANPDIAGLGIVIAFAFQAGLSIVLSVWSLVLWKSAVASMVDSSWIFQILSHRASMPIAGGKSLHDVFTGALGGLSNTGSETNLIRDARRRLSDLYRRKESRWVILKSSIDSILLAISDTQTVNGLSLLIAGLVQHKSLTLYHMHIIYDTVNFTAVSMCGSLTNVYAQQRKNSHHSRLLTHIAFIVLYMAFSAAFAIRLHNWNPTKAGQCYNSRLIVLPGHPHPSDDMVYLWVTMFWGVCALIGCGQLHSSFMSRIYEPDIGSLKRATTIVIGQAEKLGVKAAWRIVVLSMLQYPVHLYMVIALRISNERGLSDGSENEWGFGQIVAIVTAVFTLMECVRGFSDYSKAVKALEAQAGPKEAQEMVAPQAKSETPELKMPDPLAGTRRNMTT